MPCPGGKWKLAGGESNAERDRNGGGAAKPRNTCPNTGSAPSMGAAEITGFRAHPRAASLLNGMIRMVLARRGSLYTELIFHDASGVRSPHIIGSDVQEAKGYSEAILRKVVKSGVKQAVPNDLPDDTVFILEKQDGLLRKKKMVHDR